MVPADRQRHDQCRVLVAFERVDQIEAHVAAVQRRHDDPPPNVSCSSSGIEQCGSNTSLTNCPIPEDEQETLGGGSS
jgi:hypothetical protein